MNVFNLTIVFNNKVENIIVENAPQAGDCIVVNGLELIVHKMIWINTVHGNMGTMEYYTCLCEINNVKRIGVPQVKIICKADEDKLGEMVNDFIYENRHTLEILSIEYNHYACMIQYRHKRQSEIMASMSYEEQRILTESKNK